MEVVVTVIGVLGLGAFLIAAWIFVSAAKRYVTGQNRREEIEAMQSDLSPYRPWKDRSGVERRNHHNNVFPLMLDGVVIHEDRRRSHDRRRVA